MTFLEMVQHLHRECGCSGALPASVVGQSGETGRLVNFVLQADSLIQNVWLNWKFLWGTGSISLSSGTADYAGPDDLNIYDLSKNESGATKTFFLDGNYIQAEEYSCVKDTLSGFTTNGTPVLMVVLPNNQLRSIPTPAAAHTVTFDYFKKPTVMTVNASTSSIPSIYHWSIVYQAMILYGNHESAVEIKVAGQEGLAEVMLRMEAHELPANGYSHGVSDDVGFQVVTV